jgi:tRNA modification GTPase
MERAIVSEIPGTTRDTIEETILIDGVPIRLVDTAGIRSHADRLERAGIERTHRALGTASIALVVLDGSRPLSAEARALLEETRDRDRVLFFNKADLGKRGVPESVDKQTIVGSVHSADALAALRQRIADVGWNSERIDVARPHLTALHEFDAVNAALQSIELAQTALARQEPLDFVATELHHAFSSMGQVSEQTGAEEIIGGIFSRFCIGK